MDKFYHRGKECVIQWVDESWCGILAERNINYTILPVFSEEYIIYKYTAENKVGYAMELCNDIRVCITFDVPEDGWDALYNHIIHGESDTSRLKMCIVKICATIDREKQDKRIEELGLVNGMFAPDEPYTDKDWHRITLYLISCGYCKENLEIDTKGVDSYYIEEIKKRI